MLISKCLKAFLGKARNTSQEEAQTNHILHVHGQTDKLNNKAEQRTIADLNKMKKVLGRHLQERKYIQKLETVAKEKGLRYAAFGLQKTLYEAQIHTMAMTIESLISGLYKVEKAIEQVTTQPGVYQYRINSNYRDVVVLLNMDLHHPGDVIPEINSLIVDGKDYIEIITCESIGDYKPKQTEENKPEGLENMYFGSSETGYNVSWALPGAKQTSNAPPTVGEVLESRIGDQSITSLARDLGITKARLERIIFENKAIDNELAVKLGKKYNEPAEYWFNINSEYQLWLLKNLQEDV